MSPETADDYIYVPDDPEEQRRIKTRYTQRLLEAYPDAANDILQHAREEGVDAGRLEGLRRAVLEVLAARRLAVGDGARALVDAASDVKQLEAWLRAAVTAASADEALR